MPLSMRTTLLKNTATHSVIFFNARNTEELTGNYIITGNQITNAHSGTGGTIPALGGEGETNFQSSGFHLTGYHFDTSDANIQPPPKVFNEQPRRIKSIQFMHGPGHRGTPEVFSASKIEFRFGDGTSNEHRAWMYSPGNQGNNSSAALRARNVGQNQGPYVFDPPLESPLTGDSWTLSLRATPLMTDPSSGKSTVPATEFSIQGIIELVK